MTDFYLAVLSLGASTVAIVLALYLIAKTRQPSFGSKGPPLGPEKGPVITPAPQESLGVRLKRRIDRE